MKIKHPAVKIIAASVIGGSVLIALFFHFSNIPHGYIGEPRKSNAAVVRQANVSQVEIRGIFKRRFQGNASYLKKIYEKDKAFLIEPYSKRTGVDWAGEYAGKWLDASSLMITNQKDNLLRSYTDSIASALIKSQGSDGYLGISPTGSGGWKVWNLWYALDGLLSYYELTGEQSYADAAFRGVRWLMKDYYPVSNRNSAFFKSAHDGGCNVDIIDQLMRVNEHHPNDSIVKFVGGIIANFNILDSMRNSNTEPMRHAYVINAMLGGLVEYLKVEKNDNELHWVEKVWESIVDKQLFPTGGMGYKELFRKSGPGDEPNEIPKDWTHQETCTTVEWILLNSRLYEFTGNPRYTMAIEQSAYNALMGAVSPDGMEWMYYLPLRYEKNYFTGWTSCCYYSGPRGIARLPSLLYAVDGQGIRIDQYEDSQAVLEFENNAVTLEQITSYPASDSIKIRFQCASPVSFTLKLRIPAWSREWAININGKNFKCPDLRAGNYAAINRKWKNNDKVDLVIKIPIYLKALNNSTPKYGVLCRGPEVLSIDSRDNASLNIDSVRITDKINLKQISSIVGRRRYEGEVQIGKAKGKAVFTPFAEAGNENARYRTAFPFEKNVMLVSK